MMTIIIPDEHIKTILDALSALEYITLRSAAWDERRGQEVIAIRAAKAALEQPAHTSEPIREQLAAYAHQAWSGWMRYQFGKGEPWQMASGGIGWLMPARAVERWARQMNTPYADLPESEKESDRQEADRMLAIVRGKCMCTCHACKHCEQLIEETP